MTKRINTTMEAVNAGQDFALLVGKSDVYEYDNGQRTSKERVGVRLNLALQGCKMAPLAARLESDPLPELTDDQISEMCKQRKFVYVKLHDCVVSLYTLNGGMGMSATAKSAEIYANNGK